LVRETFFGLALLILPLWRWRSILRGGAFSSQVESLGDSENATKLRFSAVPVNEGELETH